MADKAESLEKNSSTLAVLSALVIISGLAVAAMAAARQSVVPGRAWLMMIALAIVVAPLGSLYIPGLKVKVIISEVVTFSCALLFGPSAAVVVAVADGAVASLRVTKTPHKFLYNVAAFASSMAVASLTTRAVFPAFGNPNAPSSASEMISATALFTLLYFLLTTSLVAAYVAVSKKQPLLKLWREDFLWTSISYLMSGAAALAAFYMVGRFGYASFLVLTGAMMMVFLFYRAYFQKVESANRRAEEMEEINHRTIEALIAALAAIGFATKMNLRRVERLVAELGQRAGCSEDDLKALRLAAMLHDIGNMAVPQQILEKPGALTAEEFGQVKVHPRIGARMVESIGFPFPVADIIRYHHERFDGTGYPEGLRGESIPLTARVLGIVDCYNALTVDRPYRQKLSRAEAIDVMKDLSGKAFDPALLEVFFDVVREIDEEACRAPSSVSISEVQAEILNHRRAWQAA
ncbi:MAG: HD-GYP domain-containing protein [Acidobacteriota bacterium]